MEYPTNKKFSVKGRDGHISGIDAPKMKMGTSWGKIKDYYDIVVWNNPSELQVLDNCGFSTIFFFNFKNSYLQLTSALVARW